MAYASAWHMFTRPHGVFSKNNRLHGMWTTWHIFFRLHGIYSLDYMTYVH